MIIGKRDELTQLRGLLKSYKSEFCAVYGRRRVGKTFLIREAFNYKFTFQHTGILDATKSEQISEFVDSVHRAGLGKCQVPKIMAVFITDSLVRYIYVHSILLELP